MRLFKCRFSFFYFLLKKKITCSLESGLRCFISDFRVWPLLPQSSIGISRTRKRKVFSLYGHYYYDFTDGPKKSQTTRYYFFIAKDEVSRMIDARFSQFHELRKGDMERRCWSIRFMRLRLEFEIWYRWKRYLVGTGHWRASGQNR